MVKQIGEGVTGFAKGDRIVTQGAQGGYAEVTVVPAARAVTIPAGVPTKVVVGLWLQGLTTHYLTTSTYPLRAGSRCLIHASAGGVGLLFCQIAKMRGAFVIGTASTPAKRALALEAGADAVVDYTSQDVVAEVRRISGGTMLDVVYDSVGKDTWEASIDSLAPRGMLVVFGFSSGAVPPMDLQLLARKGSLFVTRPTLVHHVVTREELVSRADELFGWVLSGALKVRIGAEFPLERAADAHRALFGRETTGKAPLVP